MVDVIVKYVEVLKNVINIMLYGVYGGFYLRVFRFDVVILM